MLNRIIGAAGVIVFCCGIAGAAPIGYVRPEAKRWHLGAEGGYLFTRHVEAVPSTSVYNANGMYGVGRIGYGWNDRVELYLRGGVADLDLEGIRNGAFTSLGTSSEIAWGAGASAILYSDKMWNIAGDIQYFSHADHSGVNSSGTAMDLRWNEAQAGLLLQSRFEGISPYIGVTYSHVDADVEIPAAFGDLESQDNVGAIGGVGIRLSDHVSGYIEGRLASEYAAGAGMRISF